MYVRKLNFTDKLSKQVHVHHYRESETLYLMVHCYKNRTDGGWYKDFRPRTKINMLSMSKFIRITNDSMRLTLLEVCN